MTIFVWMHKFNNLLVVLLGNCGLFLLNTLNNLSYWSPHEFVNKEDLLTRPLEALLALKVFSGFGLSNLIDIVFHGLLIVTSSPIHFLLSFPRLLKEVFLFFFQLLAPDLFLFLSQLPLLHAFHLLAVSAWQERGTQFPIVRYSEHVQSLFANQYYVASVETANNLELILICNLFGLIIILETLGTPRVLNIINTWPRQIKTLIWILNTLSFKFWMLISLQLFPCLLPFSIYFGKINSFNLFLSKVKIMTINAVKSETVSALAIAEAMIWNTASAENLRQILSFGKDTFLFRVKIGVAMIGVRFTNN